MFNVQAMLDSLSIMGYGMLGIFVSVGVIILTIYLLTKGFPASKQ